MDLGKDKEPAEKEKQPYSEKIDKRFDELVERLNQIEDLLLLVQAENLKIKQQMGFGSMAMETLPEQLQNIPKELEEIREKISGQALSRDDIESIVNEKVSATPQQPEAAPPQEGSVKVPENIQGEIDSLKQKVSQLEGTEPGEGQVKAYKEELEKAFKQELVKNNKWIESIDEKVDRYKGDLKARLEAVEDMVYKSGKMLTKKGFESYMEKISQLKADIDNTVNEFNTMKDNVEASLDQKKNIVDKLDQVELEVEKADTLISKSQLINDSAQHKLNKIEGMNSTLTSQVDNALERMTNMRDSIESRVQASINEKVGKLYDVKKAMEDRHNLLDEKVKKEVEKSEYVRTGLDNKVKDLTHNLEHVDDLYNKLNNRMDSVTENLSNKFDSKLMEIAKYKSEIGDSMESLKSELSRIDKMKNEVDVKVSHGVEQGLQDIEKKMQGMGEDLKKDVMNRVNERVHSVNQEMTSMREDTDEKLRTVENLEGLKSIDKKFESLEAKVDQKLDSRDEDIRRLHNEISKNHKETEKIIKDITMEELKKFSSEVDKSLPVFVTNEKFEKSVNLLNKRLDNVESPNLDFVESKVSNLENQVEQIRNIIDSVYNRFPIVVE